MWEIGKGEDEDEGQSNLHSEPPRESRPVLTPMDPLPNDLRNRGTKLCRYTSVEVVERRHGRSMEANGSDQGRSPTVCVGLSGFCIALFGAERAVTTTEGKKEKPEDTTPLRNQPRSEERRARAASLSVPITLSCCSAGRWNALLWTSPPILNRVLVISSGFSDQASAGRADTAR
ncbi:hypothetical protein DPEC_G00139430 [Dallia pectoralis]|uniref:Uncharacterized protein n=1 Tax=Dallia pectoralis TaxID=75939 RepID=A0ACC2GMH2_DALPE|nr:hypothetical protein DPEC_G00139430 [Dallia pectoralis]